MNHRAFLAAAVAAALCGCKASDDPSNRRPKFAISVLVDLSETWHNPSSDELDLRVLSAVGGAIVGASNRLPKPISVRYHAIGEASLGREPICSTTFRPSAFAMGKEEVGIIRSREQFARYVQSECPDMLIKRRVESSTEIVAAIVTADRALQLTRGGVPKVFIILSDFKEESIAGYTFRGVDLTGSKFLLVYRTLPEDRLDPTLQRERIAEWKRRLVRAGAKVKVIDENALLTSPKDFDAQLGIS